MKSSRRFQYPLERTSTFIVDRRYSGLCLIYRSRERVEEVLRAIVNVTANAF